MGVSDGQEENTGANAENGEPGAAPDGPPEDVAAIEQHDAEAWSAADPLHQQFLPLGPDQNSHREDSLGNHWSVPWSDLMMSMFVLFAALVTAQALEREVPEYVDREIPVETPVPSPEPSFEPLMRINVLEKSRQAVRDTNIENVEIALLDDQSVKVSVEGPMLFDPGKDALRQDAREFLNTLASVIRQTPYQVNVIGHTDDTPISNQRFASNWELSLMRATQVTRHLIDEGEVEPARFTIMGRSQYDPVISNDDDERRSLNRRVEIVITRDITESVEDRS